jgi:hypothetical protein
LKVQVVVDERLLRWWRTPQALQRSSSTSAFAAGEPIDLSGFEVAAGDFRPVPGSDSKTPVDESTVTAGIFMPSSWRQSFSYLILLTFNHRTIGCNDSNSTTGTTASFAANQLVHQKQV